MKEIRFSHDYIKLPGNWEGTEAVLISAESTILKNLNPDFLDYDTRFLSEFKNGAFWSPGHYEIKDGPVILLLFFHLNTKTLFTTIRPYTNEKFNYYVGSQGQTFILRRS